MADPDTGNQTAIVEFVLLGFGDLPDLRVLLFLLFLGVYLATMGVNSLVLLLVVANRHLHTPMYFFLGNLACLEPCYSSAMVPQMLPGLLTGDRSISVTGCITQMCFFGVLAATECCLLAAMSYDRHLAICRPLRYPTLMSSRSCLCLAAGSWLSGWFVATLFIVLLSGLMFCGPHDIDNFYCDVSPVVKLACGDTRPMVVLDIALSCVFTTSCYGTILI
uniref:G-protein coupled receptors family 1 profile domain-containing protein n=1 Tax=Pelodiscus sinensis TaxID=13735 RepID=K7F7V2_PELSI